MNRYLNKKIFQDDGFTLIELLMVVIILGVLAAVAIPQFGASTKDAKISALRSNLASIRGAIELYSVQHDGEYPTAAIEDQMTQYTDVLGAISTSKIDAFVYGPYIKNGFPNMPFATKSQSSIQVDDSTATIGTKGFDDPNQGGWLYVEKTGEFMANMDEYDKY